MYKNVKLISFLLCMAVLLCACGDKMEKYAGTWEGEQGTKLVLRADGTCMVEYVGYLFLKTVEGSWKLEDGRITVMDCFDYAIYAEANSGTELLFQSDSERWRDELFIKAEK